jgi:plasmid replication initiation protein
MAVDFNNSTWSLYNVVKQWRQSSSKSFNLHELKDLLGVAGKYQRWVDFKKRYLDQSIKDINAYSDIKVSYETQKEGRKISGVVFFIDKKQPDDVITLEPEKDRLYKALLEYGINSKVALQYSREAEEADKTAYIIERLPKIKARWDKKKEGVLQAYVITAIQQEIRQGSLLNYTPEQPKKLEHTEAWECLQEKKRLGEQCAVRERGIPGQRKRCKICLEKLPVAEYGI